MEEQIPSEPAFPKSLANSPFGLTKREYFAAKAMQAIISNYEVSCDICDRDPRYDGTNFSTIVGILSVDFAIALEASLIVDESQNLA